MPILDTAKNIIKNIKSETTALNRALRNRIDAAKVAENGVLNYETKSLEKTTIGEASGAFKAITGEGPDILGNAAKQAEFQESLNLDRNISKKLYDSTQFELYTDPAVKEALAEPVSRPVNVIGRQSGSRVPKNRITRGKTGSYVKYESPTPAVETSPVAETTSVVEDVAAPSPAAVPSPEPTPIVNNAPAQATENVIPKNAQQQAVQNTEAAQASATTTTPTPVNATTSSTENVQTPKPAHPNSPYSSTYDNEGTIDDLYEETSTQAKVRAEAERSARESKQYWGTQKTEEEESWDLYNSNTRKKDKFIPRSQYGSQQEETPWSRGMKIALGTAVTGAALCAALSSSRGQQNNAQLYGQQPLY